MSARLKAFTALIIASIIWGIAGPVIKATLAYIPAYTFLFYRFLIVGIITVPWYIFYIRKYPIKKKDIFPLTAFGYLATTVYLGLIFQGIERTSAIDGTLLGVISPLFVVILGAYYLKEHVKPHEKIGLTIAMLGTVVTIIQPLLEGKAFPLEHMTGNLLVVLGAILWAYYTFLMKKNTYSPLLLTLHSSIVAIPTLAVLALFETNFSLPSLSSILASPTAVFGLLYVSIVSYIIAYLLYAYGMSKIEISEGSIFTYLHPLFGVPLAYWWLGEAVTTPFIIGAILIAIGVVFAERK
jgi:drug/metabolite transporter (DMT)-like permease